MVQLVEDVRFSAGRARVRIPLAVRCRANRLDCAVLAQLVERSPCKRNVASSTLANGSDVRVLGTVFHDTEDSGGSIPLRTTVMRKYKRLYHIRVEKQPLSL